MTIFDILKEITVTKSELDFKNPEIDKLYDVFMINRWLSMVEAFIPIIEACNIKISKKSHYNYLKTMIPKNAIFFNYIKKNVEINQNFEIIAKFYKIGIAEAKIYYNNLNIEDVQEIESYLKNYARF